MSALWHGFSLGVMVFLGVGFLAIIVAVARAGNRGEQDAALLWAIAMRETGGDHSLIGRRGEVTAFQFLPSTWAEYTNVPASEAQHNPRIAHAVAEAHLDWLRGQLRAAGIKPTPLLLAQAWNAGSTAVILGQASHASRTYAEHVVNLYQEAVQ